MKTKKMLAGFLAMGMMVSGLTMNAFAADSVQITAGTVSAEAGKPFEVDIELSGVPSTGISVVDFGVKFDSDLISITDVTLGEIADTGAAAAEEKIDSSLADTLFDWNVVDDELDLLWVTGLTDSSKWITENGVFVTVTGKVKSSAEDGASCDLEVVPVSRASAPGATSANSSIAVGYNDEAGKAVAYSAKASDGAVTVGSPLGDKLSGDVDCNGSVTIGDVVLLARYVSQDKTLGSDAVTSQGKTNADVNADGQISSDDIGDIALYLAGLKTLG